MGLRKASQFGVKNAFKPSAAPSKNSAWITTMMNKTVSKGMKTLEILPMPSSTPMAMTIIASTHTNAKAIAICGTISVDTVWEVSACRKSFIK